mgnify:FL=1
MQACGAEVVTFGRERVDIPALMDFLGREELTSVFVEGGASVHWSFLSAGLVDKVRAFIAPMLMGGADAPTAVGGAGFESPQTALRLTDTTVEQVGADILVTGYPQYGG